MENLRSELIYLIETKGISSKEVIEASRDLDKLIVKYYQEIYYNIAIEDNIANQPIVA